MMFPYAESKNCCKKFSRSRSGLVHKCYHVRSSQETESHVKVTLRSALTRITPRNSPLGSMRTLECTSEVTNSFWLARFNPPRATSHKYQALPRVYCYKYLLYETDPDEKWALKQLRLACLALVPNESWNGPKRSTGAAKSRKKSYLVLLRLFAILIGPRNETTKLVGSHPTISRSTTKYSTPPCCST